METSIPGSTEQEVFDLVAKEMLTYGDARPAFPEWLPPAKMHSLKLCCAAGWIFSQEEYEEHRDLLLALQEIRGNTRVEFWDRELVILAHTRGLSDAVINKIRSRG